MILPCRWSEGGLGIFAGRVRFRRRFGYPGRIDCYERVWLTFAGLEGTADVILNGHGLGRQKEDVARFEFDVTALLQQRNELVVEVESLTGDGGLVGEVALEVRCSAYLRRIRMSVEERQLHVCGELVGVCERPLDLYVLLDRATIGYTTLEASVEGRQFHLDSAWPDDQDPAAPHLVRVELVNGAMVWYAHEQTV